jgi:DNA-binding MarR family transcriptional regulator
MQDDRLRTSLGHAVVRLFRLVNRATNRALKGRELSAEQAHILLALWIEGPMAMGALQRLLALSSPTLTGAIDRMEAQSLVRRVPSPDDRRVSLLEPRLPARKRSELEALLVDSDRRSFAVLTAAERKELLRLLDKCIAGLDASV